VKSNQVFGKATLICPAYKGINSLPIWPTDANTHSTVSTVSTVV